jgi:hypothetical protein
VGAGIENNRDIMRIRKYEIAKDLAEAQKNETNG